MAYILRVVVLRENFKDVMLSKCMFQEAWQQVTEVIMTFIEKFVSGEEIVNFIFEVMQELFLCVSNSIAYISLPTDKVVTTIQQCSDSLTTL